MAEGLSAAEVGKEIAEHKKHAGAAQEGGHQDRWLSILEALLLSLVAVLAAYSGYAAAKWSTESSVTLAKASFNAWFTAFTAGSASAQQLAVRRMRPGYRPAFNAWLATDPAHNPNAPAGPAYMPQYVIPQQAAAKAHDVQADAKFAKGAKAGSTADKYIRDTVFLATVLFLVGIAGHFPVRQARLGLIAVGGAMLVFAVIQLLGLPGPPDSLSRFVQ
jgi:hypothetical protein